MSRAQRATLKELIPGDVFVGVSLILRRRERFLYGVRAPRQVDGRSIFELTGIGGAREAQDASLWAAAVREAEEETAAAVSVLPCPVTVVVRSQTEIERISLQGEQPAALVFRNHRTPPHQPWHEDHRGRACLVVFAAVLEGRPRPAMELPHLIWLKPEHILRTAREDVPLDVLVETGAEMIFGSAGLPPSDSWTRLTDSQEALALALGDSTLSFYQSLPGADD